MIQSVLRSLENLFLLGIKMKQHELCMDLLLMICCICLLDYEQQMTFKWILTFKTWKEGGGGGAESHEFLLLLTVLENVVLEWEGSNCFDYCFEKKWDESCLFP